MDARLRQLEREGDPRYTRVLERATGRKKLTSNERWLLMALGYAPLIATPKPKSNGEDYWIYLLPQSRWVTLEWRNVNYIITRFMKSRALSELLYLEVQKGLQIYKFQRKMIVRERIATIIRDKDWKVLDKVIKNLLSL